MSRFASMSRFLSCRTSFGLLICGFGILGLVWSQVEQAGITGTVMDATGAAIPDVHITATNTETQVTSVTQTNGLGYYNLPYLPVGQYTVKAEKNGFQTGETTGVLLKVGLIATINIKLSVGAVQQNVTVSANPVMIEQQAASLGNVVSTTQITQLPLLGRDPYQLIGLAPGVLPGGNDTPVIDGGRGTTSAVLLDGADTRASSTNGLSYDPPLESVQEFKVITSNASAEYGRSSGGFLIAVGQSGTNDLHGSFYEFLRNDKLNANGWTNNRNGLARSAFRFNQYGAAAGGPVFIPRVYNGKNRTFFFVNFEQVKQRTPDNLFATVPTAAEHGGDFSHTVNSSGALIRIFDPASTRPDPANPGQYIRDQFPGNIIPTARISPISTKIMQYFPMPNRNSIVNNYVLNNTRLADSTNWFYRFDHDIGSKSRIFFRHGINQLNNDDGPWPNLAFPGEGISAESGSNDRLNQTFILSDTTGFRPNLVGEFRVTFNRTAITAIPRSQGFDVTQIGLPAYLKQGGTQRFPEFDIADISTSVSEGTSLGPARASYQHDAENNGQLQAHINWIQSAHTLKAGFESMFLAFNVTRPDWPSGDFSFSRAYTQGPNPLSTSATSGFGPATLLLGVPTGGTESVDRTLAASQRYYMWYLQDDWKVTRKLTLNLGVRYEYQTPWTERYNQLSMFDPNATDPLTGRKGVLIFVGRNGYSRYDARPNKNNYMPRIGLAYQFAKNTVFRAAYGIYYFPGNGGIGAGQSDLGSAGFQVNTGIFLGPPVAAPNTPPPGASLANPFLTGLLLPPNTGVGGGIGAPFPDWLDPRLEQWNANVQHSFGRDLLVEAGYIGNHGEHIWANENADAADPMYLSLGNTLNNLVPNPFYGVITTGSLSTPTIRQSQLLVPYPHYTGITAVRASIGDSSYHAFTLRVDKRMSGGLMLQAAYTISKFIDDVPDRFIAHSSLINPLDLSRSRSISDQDRPQVLVTNFVYELPFGYGKRLLSKGVPAKIFGNWQVSGITTFSSGQPVVITSPCNTGLPGIGCYAVRLHSPVLGSGQNINGWFDTTAFRPAPAFSTGTDSRTEPNLRDPGLNNWNLGLSRTQVIRERIRVQFRGEFFGAFNHPQFGAPQGSVTSTNFGQITSASGTRNIQLGIRISY